MLIKTKLSKLRSDRRDNYYNWNFRNARLERGYTRLELAEIVGLSPTAISAYERMRFFPVTSIAVKLAEVLDCNVEEIFPDRIRGHVGEIKKERSGDLNKRYFRILKKKVESRKSLDEMRIRRKRWLYQQAYDDFFRLGYLERLRHPESLEELSDEEKPGHESDYAAEIDYKLFKDTLDQILGSLSYRERTVLRLRFGLDDSAVLTLDELADIFKVGKERISQIELRSLRKLQEPHNVKRLEKFLYIFNIDLRRIYSRRLW